MLTNVIGTIVDIKEEQFFTSTRGDKISKFCVILETYRDDLGNNECLAITFVNHYYEKFKIGQKICCRIFITCKNKDAEFPLNSVTAVDCVIDSGKGGEKRRKQDEFLKRPDYGKRHDSDGFGNVIYNSQ